LLVNAVFLGLATGMVVAIPVGPAAIESIRWTITKGFRKGILVVIGALTVDALDAILLNFGLLNWLENNGPFKAIFWMASGAATFYIGYRGINTDPTVNLKDQGEVFQKKAVFNHPSLTGFVIAFSYPMTHFAWFTFSTTFIRYWHDKGGLTYGTFVASMLLGMFTTLATINYLASKGRRIIKYKENNRLEEVLPYIIAFLGAIFFIKGFIHFCFICPIFF
jgi:threonine/homoserine/homoserine lactone efflux protein